MELRSLVSSLEYLVSNERQVLLGGVRLDDYATPLTLPLDHCRLSLKRLGLYSVLMGLALCLSATETLTSKLTVQTRCTR